MQTCISSGLDADAETVDLLIGNFPILPLKDMDGRPTPSTLVLGQVVGVHIASAFLKDGLFDLVVAGTIARCGYRDDCTQVTSLFEMLRPTAAETGSARSG